MLERTAAGLESRSLQRVLPKPTKSYRQLHTGFWQHGASALDLSSIWPKPTQATDTEPTDVDSSPRHPQQAGLLASSFLLDFLFPSPTLPLLRRIYPRLPRTQDGQRKPVVLRRRQFSSSTSDPIIALTISDTAGLKADTAISEDGNAPITETQSESINLSACNAEEALIRLNRLLSDDTTYLYSEVWDLYSLVDPEHRLEVRARVVTYLARSRGVVELGRALSVFRQIPIHEWNQDLLASGVLLFLRSGYLTSAIEQFKTGIESNGLTGGLEYILKDAVSSKKWEAALNVWVAYYTAEVKRNPARKPTTERLKSLEDIPNQGDLYFAFRGFMATDGAHYQNMLEKSSTSSAAFRIFRDHFARRALWQPCSPEQATIILESMKDKNLYNDYLVRMFNRWYEKSVTRATMLKLPAIYQMFRALPGAQPAMPVLRGMFKIHFPNNIVALEQLYQDWVRFRGGLNQWSYEKFLKLYAYRGDVAVVQQLWSQYVKEFPTVLQTPRAFRSTLNVYAQAGDATQAERVLEEMSSKYGVEPDLDCWNTLLKAYMRANNYAEVLRCFDRISDMYYPDSFTYAHVMAMSSKKGDLETTLDFFKRSQDAGVPITKEIGLALVVAHCQNELLTEAEALCVQLAERKLTVVALWNQLLNFNGEARDLKACFRILEHMKRFDIEWDDDTNHYLLQALINVNHIHAAYALLKSAEKESLFTVTSDHYAIVMAGATRVGEDELVMRLHDQLLKSNIPVGFNALLSVVESAMRRKPGVERTLRLSNELVEQARNTMAGSPGEPGRTVTSGFLARIPKTTAVPRSLSQSIGRAIMVLVELREFASAEELMTIFRELFPQFQNERYPPNVMSALMLAYYKDDDFDTVLELWRRSWKQALESSKKGSQEGIYAGHEYDLSRVINLVLRVYRDKDDVQGLSDCIDQVTNAGFKMTRATWSLAVRYLAELDRWDRAMYWCETMLMDGWCGWNWENNGAEKALTLNTRVLGAPKNIVFLLQQNWLELRRAAAWSEDVSRKLDHVEAKFPRLYHAFTSLDVDTMPPFLKTRTNSDRRPVKKLDKVLRGMSYEELMKTKEALYKQLEKEQQREKSPGIATVAPKSEEERQAWKRKLQRKIQRFATSWAERRTQLLAKITTSSPDGESPSSSAVRKSDSALVADTEQLVAQERSAYWNDIWGRYDQGPHRDSPLQHAKDEWAKTPKLSKWDKKKKKSGLASRAPRKNGSGGVTNG
ncbi:hypothetical protein EDB81DRAFT_783508 [Dactylonectria macrodidyma]|uniref:CoxI translation protein CYA5 n=1 Tax=Dactylonectria macrodidyma TaxID=307937 RepID=A0A9P9JD04_9HYPO|nr:hypothetical protein EDB81DRAFT_783508 [Dactylonectria macrodidyma]